MIYIFAQRTIRLETCQQGQAKKITHKWTTT